MKTGFKKEDYIYVEKIKSKGRTLYKYICPKGHEGTVRKDHWKKGVRCAACAGNKRLTIERIRTDIEKDGYTLLTKKYVNSKQLLVTRCPKGHIYKVSRNNWSQGYRCSTCSGKTRHNLLSIKNKVNEENYELLSKQYTNSKTPIILLCPNGHEYEVLWDNWFSKNSRCPKCSEWGTSKQENELYKFIEKLNIDIIRADRSLISPLELDMVIPSKKIAIEYCGLYWHSELMGKYKNYHLNKLEACKKVGYKLITIFEDELISKKDIVFSRLLCILGTNKVTTLYSRRCIIKEISFNDAKFFCDSNHLQGYGHGASIRLGAYYENELVGVMTFSKPSLSKGHKSHKDGVWELSRFCCKTNLRVVGLASKFLKYFKRHYCFNEIFSYADRRWSVGNMYEKIGFNVCSETKPNYWYFKNNKSRIHRFALRKKVGESKDITEWELRRSQGWNRIWDCGNLKFILEKEITGK